MSWPSYEHRIDLGAKRFWRFLGPKLFGFGAVSPKASTRRKPDIEGMAGEAWLVPFERLEAYAHRHPEKMDPALVEATVSNWCIHGLNWHPWWSWWKVVLLELSRELEEKQRSADGTMRPWDRHYPGAVWELVIVAFEPRAGAPDVNGEGEPPFGKAELQYQFHGVTREAARDIVTLAVQAMCSGAMTPDIDPRGSVDWCERLSRMVSDYHRGKFGGPKRHPLEIDPLTGRLTGRIAS